MMKRNMMAFLLVLALTLGISIPALAAESPLPTVGQTLHGFTVTDRSALDLNAAPTLTLAHVQSGATVYYVASDDRNRTFDIIFRTPALDDRGMSHILEHSSLAGGKKYTSPNLFFAAANQTYNTFVNAITTDTITSYPVSSLSEDQLLALMDLYLDGVFHPALYTDKRIFDREAWRYELEGADAPITRTGTVLNEMKGAVDISRAAASNATKALFPGTILGSNSGGAPQAIPDLTWEDLVGYHKTYYHPSNSLIVLNGKLDLDRILAFLDKEYLSDYTKTSVAIDRGEATPLTAPVFQRFAYPVEQGATTDRGSVVNYGMATASVSREDAVGLNLLADILCQDTSPVSAAVGQALPGASFSAYANLDFAQPFVMFTAQGLNEGDANAFQAAVDKGLAALVTGGLADGAAAAVSQQKLSYLFLNESSQFGPSMASMMATCWATDGELDYLNFYAKSLDEMQKKDGSGYFESLAQTHLIDNPWSALTVTVPVPGLQEQNAAAETQALADKKADMTDAEIAAMVQATADFKRWSAQTPTKAQVSALQAVTVSDLPEDLRKYPITDRVKNGVRSLTAQLPASGLAASILYFDLSALSSDDLLWASLYANLVGKLGSDTHTAAQLGALTAHTLGSAQAYVTAMPQGKGAHAPLLGLQWVAPTADPSEALFLAEELLFHTDVSDVATLKNLVAQFTTAQKSALNAEPMAIQQGRAKALLAPEKYATYDHMTGLAYAKFLSDVEVHLALNPALVTEKLSAIQASLQNRYNATALFTGDKAAIAAWNKASADFWARLPLTKTTPVDRTSLPRPAEKEGVAADAAVQYNMLFAPLAALGLQDSGKLDVTTAVLNDRYLTPQTRHILGAYGSDVAASEDGLTLSTYRDPALGKTYEVFAAAAQAIRALDLTQADLDGYIMSSYSSMARPRGLLTGAINAMTNQLMGRDTDYTLQRMRQVKATTLADVAALAPALDALNAKGFRSTVGGAAALEENAARFDAILYPNGRAEGTLTRAQAVAHLPGAVLLGDDTGNKNEGDSLTREQLAVLLYRMGGVPIGAVSQVTDLPQVSPWAREAVLWCVSVGLLATDEGGNFNPYAQVSRSALPAA